MATTANSNRNQKLFLSKRSAISIRSQAEKKKNGFNYILDDCQDPFHSRSPRKGAIFIPITLGMITLYILFYRNVKHFYCNPSHSYVGLEKCKQLPLPRTTSPSRVRIVIARSPQATRQSRLLRCASQ